MSKSEAKALAVPIIGTVRRPLAILPRLFKDLTPSAQQKIREGSHGESLHKGQVVVQTGQIFRDIIIVQSGWLALEIDDVCVNLLSTNAVYFICLENDAQPATCNLAAVSDADVAVISKEVFRGVAFETPQVLLKLCDGLLQNMVKAFVDTAKRGTEPLEVRLANFLWGISLPVEGGSRRIPSAIPQPYLASYLGASREEISRKRQMLIRAGYMLKHGDDWYMERSTLSSVKGYGLGPGN